MSSRTVVLDGAAPFAIALPLYNAWGAQRALDRLLADCAAEPACRSAYPRLREELDEVFSRLPVRASLRHPQTGRLVEITVSRGGFASGLRGMLYTPAHASLLPWVVRSAHRGDFSPFAALSLETAAWSTDTMSLGLTLSVLCSEDVRRIRDNEAERAVRGTFLGDFEIATWRRMCEPWPRGPLPVLDDRPVRVPALVLSGDLDPVTPPRWGEAMKKHFPDALHVIVPGAAHNRGLTHGWRARGAPAALRRIRRKVRRQGHWMVLLTLFELAGCAALLAWVWKASLEQPRAIGTVGFAGTAVLVVLALAFSLWNRRGIWAPASESTLTFVELSLERQRRKLVALRFGPWLLALELAFLVPWSLWALLSRPAEPWRWFFAFGWMIGMSALLLAWWAWYRRRTLRETAEWEELRRALRGE